MRSRRTVVVAAEEQAAALRERDGGDAADDVVVRVHAELLVRADVEQAARRVVRAGREQHAVREVLHTALRRVTVSACVAVPRAPDE